VYQLTRSCCYTRRIARTIGSIGQSEIGHIHLQISIESHPQITRFLPILQGLHGGKDKALINAVLWDLSFVQLVRVPFMRVPVALDGLVFPKILFNQGGIAAMKGIVRHVLGVLVVVHVHLVKEIIIILLHRPRSSRGCLKTSQGPPSRTALVSFQQRRIMAPSNALPSSRARHHLDHPCHDHQQQRRQHHGAME
jgi:hypothetical protein